MKKLIISILAFIFLSADFKQFEGNGKTVLYRSDRQKSQMGFFKDGKHIEGIRWIYNNEADLIRIETISNGEIVSDSIVEYRTSHELLKDCSSSGIEVKYGNGVVLISDFDEKELEFYITKDTDYDVNYQRIENNENIALSFRGFGSGLYHLTIVSNGDTICDQSLLKSE